MKRAAVGVAAAILQFMLAVPAHAHGDLQRSDPQEGQRVKKPPAEIVLTLAEPPAAGSTLRVTDGCRDKVPVEIAREGSDLMATVAGGRPGHWMVRYQSVSAVDGHVVKGWLHFQVAGKRDCSAGTADTSPTDGTEIGGGAGTQVENDDPPDEGGRFPIVGLGVGTIVLVGLALLLRRSTA